MQEVILISGIPGSGKSTIASLLAKSFSKSVYLSGDDIRLMVKGGFESPAKVWDQATREQYYLSFANEAVLANNFIRNGYLVVIDDVIHPGDLYQEWQKHFEKLRCTKVALQPDIRIVQQRNRERGKYVEEGVINRLYEDFRRQNFDDWIVVDNSHQTPKETTQIILSKLES